MPSTDTEKTRKRAVRNLAKTVSETVFDKLDDQGIQLDETEDPTLEAEITEDVFVQGSAEVIAKGGSARFKIKRNGEFLTTVNHPYSWDKLQAEHGGGFYIVTCINQKGQHVKQESQQVAGPEPEDTSFAFRSTDSVGKQPSMMEMVTFMKTLNSDSETKLREATETAKREAREASEKADRDARRSSTEQTSLFTIMMESQKSSMTMFMEMMKQNAESQRASVDAQNKLFERLNDKIEKASAKPPAMDPIEFFKQVREAEDAGYRKATEMHEKIDTKARELADELAESREEEPSGISGLIKSIIPVISQAVASQSGNAQNPPLQSQIVAPMLPPTPEQINAAKANREHQLKVARHNQEVARQQEVARFNREKIEAQNRARVQADNLGLPQAVPTLVPVPGPGSAKEKLNGHFKEHVSTLVIPVIAEYLVQAGKPEEAARASLKLLAEKGITHQDVMAGFSYDDIISLARKNDIPEQADPWFKNYWEAIVGDNVQNPPGISAHSEESRASL